MSRFDDTTSYIQSTRGKSSRKSSASKKGDKLDDQWFVPGGGIAQALKYLRKNERKKCFIC